MPGKIANSDLAEGDLPPPDADEETIWAYARTFDGYNYTLTRDFPGPPASDNLVWKLGMMLANPARGEFFRSGDLPGSLGDLRACLFFEWRRLHHQGRWADQDMMRYLHALVEAMRRQVRAGERT